MDYEAEIVKAEKVINESFAAIDAARERKRKLVFLRDNEKYLTTAATTELEDKAKA